MNHESAAPEDAKEPPGITAQADEVQDPPKPTPPTGKQSDAEIYVKRHRGIVALLVIFVIITAAAFIIYPRRQAVYRPQYSTMSVESTAKITDLSFAVARHSANQLHLEMEVWTDAPTRPLTSVAAEIRLQLPAPLAPGSCKPPQCSSGKSTQSYYPGPPYYVTYVTNSFKKTSAGWYWTDTFLVNAPLFGFDENGLDVEANLPEVQVLRLRNQPADNPSVDIVYFLQDPHYDWNGGPSPSDITRDTIHPQLGWLVDWDLTANQLSNPVSVSGTDNSNAAQDNFRTFASGALLGIAGGALIGAVQEATTSKRRTKSSTS
jgi:hypothetical protein